MRYRLAILLVLFVRFSIFAFADVTLTPESAVQLALEKNPELQAAQNLIAEAEGRARSSGRLANPELETEIAGGKDSEGRIAVGLTQPLPLTSRLRLERNLSALDVELARLEVREKERQLSEAVRTAVYKLAFARESIKLAERQSTVAQSLAKSLQASATQGIISSLDARQAALAGEEIESTKEALRVEEILATGQLASLLGLQANTALTVKESLALPRALPPKHSLGLRPDIRMAELAVKMGAVGVSLAKASTWEDMGVGVFAEGERFRDEPEGIEPEQLAGIRLSIPIPLWQNGKGKVIEKQAVAKRHQQNLEALRLAAHNQVLARYSAMAGHYRAAAKIESRVLPHAREQLADTQAAYERGEIDIQTLFRARERLVALELTALESRKNFFLSYAEWLTAIGDQSTQP